MLSLEITGYGYSKRLCKAIVCWFIAKYFPRHKLEIEVLHRGLKREYALGYCDVAEETKRPRSFLIEMDTYMDKRTYATVLIHELIHVRQWIKSELKLKSSKMHYKGKCVEDLHYWEKPHEIFAHHYEGILYQSYLKDRGLTTL
jgi:hypothetical protein